MLVLRGSRLPVSDGDHHRDRWTVRAGEHYNFSTTWFASYKAIPPPLDISSRIQATHERSSQWASRCTYEGPYRAEVVRSLLTLRLLTDTRRGGIVAAATTSLPEDFGGVRNWDYRYCWLRDASLTLEALLQSGYVGTAKLWGATSGILYLAGLYALVAGRGSAPVLVAAGVIGTVGAQPLVDAEVAKTWNIPASWKLTAQMPFGSNEAAFPEKTFMDDELRFRTHR